MKKKKEKEEKKPFLKKRVVYKKLLKIERPTLVIKSHKDIPYKSSYFKERGG